MATEEKASDTICPCPLPANHAQAQANDETSQNVGYDTVNDNGTIFDNPYILYSFIFFVVLAILLSIAICIVWYKIRKSNRLKLERIENTDDESENDMPEEENTEGQNMNDEQQTITIIR
eukprot:467281_1